MRIRLAFLIVVLFYVNFSQAQESMMSDISYPFLEKLIATAKRNYPRVQALELQKKIAWMAINKAKTGWFDIANFTYLYSPSGTVTLTNPTFTSGYQVGLTTSIGNILQKPGMVRVAKQQYKIAELTEQEYLLTLESLVKQRYFTYVQAMAVLNWRNKDIISAETGFKDIKYRFEKGEVQYENYNRAQEFYSTSIQTRIQAEGTMLVAKSNLEEIVGEKLEDVK